MPRRPPSLGVDTPPPPPRSTPPPPRSPTPPRQLRLLRHRAGGSGLGAFECRLDSPPGAGALHLAARTNRPADGPHTFEVRATDKPATRCLAPASLSCGAWDKPPRPPTPDRRAVDPLAIGPRLRRAPASRAPTPAAPASAPWSAAALRRMGGLLLAAELRRARRGLPQLRSEGDRQRRQRRSEPGLLQLERRHHRAADADRLPPGGAHQRRRRQLHLLGHRHGWLGRRRLRMPPRRRRLGALHLAAELTPRSPRAPTASK